MICIKIPHRPAAGKGEDPCPCVKAPGAVITAAARILCPDRAGPQQTKDEDEEREQYAKFSLYRDGSFFAKADRHSQDLRIQDQPAVIPQKPNDRPKNIF